MELVFNDITVNNDGSFTYQDQTYQWLDFKEGRRRGQLALRIDDENFPSEKIKYSMEKEIFYIKGIGQTKGVACCAGGLISIIVIPYYSRYQARRLLK